MVFDLVFANNTISSCLFLFFLIIDLHFLVPAVIAQIFNPTANTGIPTKEAKAEIETHSVTVDATIRRFSI